MYRALYGFRSAEPSSLAFAAGETFLLLERSNQHWWLVTRAGSGETGYVPASYLQRLQVRQGAKGGQGLTRDSSSSSNGWEVPVQAHPFLLLFLVLGERAESHQALLLLGERVKRESILGKMNGEGNSVPDEEKKKVLVHRDIVAKELGENDHLFNEVLVFI
ncbi:UNVERIFIED_CONTAM: hypothetical protein K2H54_050363 [Gekko kuhli]